MSDIISDFSIYLDKFGLYQDKPNQTSQNGALFTVESLFCILSNLDKNDPNYSDQINKVKVALGSLEVKPGLSVRSPGSEEFDSIDNSVALLSFSALYDEGNYAKRMRLHGETTYAVGVDESQAAEQNKKLYPLAQLLNLGSVRYYWNNNHPDKFCFFGWFGRSPGFLGLLDLAAKGKTTPFRAFALWVGQFVGLLTKKSDSDARKLPYVIWQYLKTRNWFWKASYSVWLKVVNKQYANGMRDVYAGYFGPNHPLTKWTRTDV